MPTREQFRRRRLPHWDLPGAIYFITTCLRGSIPAKGLLELARFRAQQRKLPRPAALSEPEWAALQWKKAFVLSEEWLDRKPAARRLADARLAAIVVDALYHFAGDRYDLLSFVVMPSHLHWLFRPRDEWVAGLGPLANDRAPRERITQSIKGYTSRECNRVMGRSGTFWQAESYDHCVRDEDELERIVTYIEHNPVQAGLVARPEDWAFSSAHDRARLGLAPGEALPGARAEAR